jgi:hypothetical protein
MQRRPIVRKAVKTAIVANTARQLSRRWLRPRARA